MKKKLRTEIMAKLDQIYVDTVGGLFPTMEVSETQLAAVRDMWKSSLFRKKLEDYCREVPDEQAPLLQNLLQRFPLEIRKHLKNVHRSVNSFGGRTPLLTDGLRRDACEEIRKLQQRGLKLQRAIADVAPLYGLTPTQLAGIWKHKARYKD